MIQGVTDRSFAKPRHRNTVYRLIGWTGYYTSFTPCVFGAKKATVHIDQCTIVQPHVLLLIDPAAGGQTRISEDDLVEDAPEWIGAIVATSADLLDHAENREVYRRNGVREYVVWRVLDQQIDWFTLHGSEFERLQPDAAGILRSEVFPGLWLDAAALIRGDMPRVLEVVQQGLATPEHAAFLRDHSIKS